jgi:hypothetical protein
MRDAAITDTARASGATDWRTEKGGDQSEIRQTGTELLGQQKSNEEGYFRIQQTLMFKGDTIFTSVEGDIKCYNSSDTKFCKEPQVGGKLPYWQVWYQNEEGDADITGL